MKGAPLLILLGLLALLVAGAACARPEAEASEVRLAESGLADVAAVWHEPAEVQPGNQWTGHIQFYAGHNVTNVLYQICRVGTYCFAPPTAAERINETLWSFDTSNYIQAGSGRPVQYGAGWRVGYQFLLEDAGGTTFFPHGIDPSDPACAGDAWMDCAETHYFAFNVAGSPEEGRGAPGLGPFGVLVALGLVGAAQLGPRIGQTRHDRLAPQGDPLSRRSR